MKSFSNLCNRILVVAAHPDDEVLGCGGTIAKLSHSAAEVHVLVLGEGSSCRFSSPDLDREDILDAIRIREEAATKAMAILGGNIQLDLLRNPCGRFDQAPLIELGKQVEEKISKFQPDTIFTHSSIDANNDHRQTFQAVLQATRPIPGSSVKRVLSFEIPSSTEWRFVEAFQPNIFIDISDTLESKIKAMEAYGAEQRAYPFPRSAKGLETYAHMRGMQSGCNAAEGFQLIRWIP